MIKMLHAKRSSAEPIPCVSQYRPYEHKKNYMKSEILRRRFLNLAMGLFSLLVLILVYPLTAKGQDFQQYSEKRGG
jgi:hypothetical protein